MIGLIFFEYSKKLFRNIFVALLMSIICLTSVLIYSTLLYHRYQFKPFREFENKSEMTYFVRDIYEFNDNTTDIIKKNKTIYRVKYSSVFKNDERGELLIYDKWIWKNWVPRLKKGKWLDKNKENSELPEVVYIGKDNVEIGDVIEATYYVSSSEQKVLKCKVSGVLQYGASVITECSLTLGTERYFNCYSEINEEKLESVPFFILMRSEDNQKYNISDLQNYYASWAIVSYKTDGMTQDEIIETKAEMLNKMNGSGVPYDVFMKNSKNLYELQIAIYLPLFFLSLYLVALVIYNVTRIDLQDSSYDHSVYYLLGANKKRCNRISTYKLLINISVSVILFICEVIIYSKIAEKYNLNFYTGSYIAMIAVFIYAGLMLYTVLVNYLMSRGMTPVDMLRKNRTAI